MEAMNGDPTCCRRIRRRRARYGQHFAGAPRSLPSLSVVPATALSIWMALNLTRWMRLRPACLVRPSSRQAVPIVWSRQVPAIFLTGGPGLTFIRASLAAGRNTIITSKGAAGTQRTRTTCSHAFIWSHAEIQRCCNRNAEGDFEHILTARFLAGRDSKNVTRATRL